MMLPALKNAFRSGQVNKVIAIYEGVWSGSVLIDLYARTKKLGLNIKICGTDINPVAVALFKIYATIVGIPKDDFFACFNDLSKPLCHRELEQFGLQSDDSASKILNLYFRALIDLDEKDLYHVFSARAKEMKAGDLFVVTLVEDSESCQAALEQTRLVKVTHGNRQKGFFSLYQRVDKSKYESSVLVMDQGRMAEFLANLEQDFQLVKEGSKTVWIKIDLGEKPSNSFEATVFVLKKVVIISKTKNEGQYGINISR